ncbi:hypothetical protein Celaphus_00016680 [Cervus elaphus hippelaphus]|uniref:Protocadherin domain-containing protein n=1 Tax=Cervus elaphus hippelaphus TaxID=46360 RepID=A0A212C4N4_CEREH|nr:hypothetical protein Celaphus_00016680 [Cervus elaphus hippelaphus]
MGTMETPLDRNIGDSSQPYQNEDYLTIMIAIVAGAMVVIVVIFVTVLNFKGKKKKNMTVLPQDEFYDQASPDKRTEADGNSDPNSEYRLPTTCIKNKEVYLQKK